MNPKERLKALGRNPWVQRGALIGALLSTSGACARPPETAKSSTDISPSAQATITAQQRQIEALQTAIAETKSPKSIPTFPPITPTFKPSPTETPKPVEKPVEEGWGFYTTLLYKIDVPTNWQLVAAASPIQIQSGDAFDSFGLLKPGELLPVAQFTIQTKPGIQMSLDDYARNLRGQFQREGDISDLKESRVTIDRQPAIRFSYTRERNPRLGEEDYYFIRKGKIWMILTVIKKPGLETQIKPILDRMVFSFKFLN